MNRLDRWALGVVIVTTALALIGHSSVANDYYMRQIGPGTTSVWVTGWFVATYTPIGTVVMFWRWSKRSSLPWLYHLLLLPSMSVLFAAGERLMLSAIIDPDFDAMFGGPVLPAVLAFFLGAVGYMTAVIVRQFRAPAGQVPIK